jgi:PhnB protein
LASFVASCETGSDGLAGVTHEQLEENRFRDMVWVPHKTGNSQNHISMSAKTTDASVANIAVTPYLFFNGRCDEALEFYQRALGATVAFVSRFKDSPDPAHAAPGMEEKVLHATFKVGKTEILASDGRCEGKTNFQGFSLALTVPGVAEAEQFFAALADGGKVNMPLAKTFFSPRFGMLEDRFGVGWMVYVAPESR